MNYEFISITELSTRRMNPRVGSRSGWVGSGHDFAGFWRVGSGQHFGIVSLLLIISGFLNQCESSNTAFGLIVFSTIFNVYNNELINK